MGAALGDAGWVFADRRQGRRAFITFASLYTVIYALLRMEDNALLVGNCEFCSGGSGDVHYPQS